MTEAINKVEAAPQAVGPAAKLLALYAYGSDEAYAGSEKLTFRMIEETAGWLSLPEPKTPEQARIKAELAEGAVVVAREWLGKIKKHCGEEEAEDYKRAWVEAWAEKLNAANARVAEAKTKAEKVKAIIDAVPEPAPVAPKPKPTAAPKARLAEGWPEAPLPPPDATPEERLLYPPGLLGHVVQHIIDTDMYPDRRMALWGGLAALSKALDRKVIGPTGSTTALYLILLAATAAGKQHSHDCIRILLRAMGVENLVQAGGLASVQATEDIIKATPNCLVLIDEFGRWLRMVLAQTANVSELPGTLCKFWAMRPAGSWTITRRAREEVKSVTVDWPALALSGCSTAQQFWDACSDDEITGGFLNRCVIFDAGTGAKKRAKPKYPWDELPRWLAKELKDRAGRPASAEPAIITKTEGLLGPRRMGWGEGAEELWGAAADAIRELPEGRKRDIFARGDELAVRLATVRGWCEGPMWSRSPIGNGAQPWPRPVAG
jgi:hypothetical protein